MDLQTLQYREGRGWSVKPFPTMDSEQTLILVFAAPEFRDNLAPIRELAKNYPHSTMIGCSTSGEIMGSAIFDHSLSVAIIRFEKTRIKMVKTKIQSSADSFSSGKYISEQLNASDLKAIFVLSEALNINASRLVTGLNQNNTHHVVITGGLAGDGDRFKKTWVLCNGEIYTDHVVSVGFYGRHIQVGHASRGGWDIFGPERRVTRSKDNILYELDHKPALTLYKEYLGDRAKDLPATGLLFPLAIRKTPNDPKQLVRTIYSVNEEEQSLIFGGDIPMGYFAQLMRANFDRLVASADEAGDFLVKNFIKENPLGPILLVSISCVGRRLLLGERTEEETEAVLEAMPQGTSQIGFYSYGELSPYATGDCDFHNQTMTITTFCEK